MDVGFGYESEVRDSAFGRLPLEDAVYEWRVKPTGILVTYDGLSNVASPLGLPAALGRE
jgi:hypothetical protein